MAVDFVSTDAQHELRNIQDVGNQRLEQLRRYHKHTYDAVMWLRQNRDKFKATIHEPIILCVSAAAPPRFWWHGASIKKKKG